MDHPNDAAAQLKSSPVFPPGAEEIRTSGSIVRVEARSHRSWDEALALVAFNQGQRPQAGQATLTLLRANHHLAHIGNLDELLRSILADAIAALDAQRGSIILADDSANYLRLKAFLQPGRPNAIPKYSKTLSERCFRGKESLLCRDLSADQNSPVTRSMRSGNMSSLICALLRSPRQEIGVLQLDRGPRKPRFIESDLHLADAIAASVALGIESAQLFELQRDQFEQTVTTLARAVELRDQYTGEHTSRVKDYSLLLAEALNLSGTDKYRLRIGTPLHDIGKIGIDDAILRKRSKLTPDEFELMKTHTVKGAEIVRTIVGLAPMLPIVRNHHEKWDGSGYPDGLKETKIELTARIVAVADAFDAMTSNRPYRQALPTDVAFAELVSHAGRHFDPTCVSAFVGLREKVEQRMARG